MWMEKCYTRKSQSLENGLSRLFQAIGNILLPRCRASMTKQRQQSTKVKAKCTDLIRSQACSLLHSSYIVPSKWAGFTHYSQTHIGLLSFFSCTLLFLELIYIALFRNLKGTSRPGPLCSKVEHLILILEHRVWSMLLCLSVLGLSGSLQWTVSFPGALLSIKWPI